jgi:hypothetical protein
VNVARRQRLIGRIRPASDLIADRDHGCARPRRMLTVLILLQALKVAFLWLHDWVPLAPLNDVSAVWAVDTTGRLIRVTLIRSAPITIGPVFSLVSARTGFPGRLRSWLRISYGLLLAGELRAWWLPYLIRPEPERAARYRALFGATHAFLPPRQGIVPNTRYAALHVCAAAMLLVLAALTV